MASVFDGHEEEIRSAFAEGKAAEDVARTFGRGKEALRRWCKEHGIEPPRPAGAFEGREGEIRQAFAAGLSVGEIAKSFGRKERTLREFCNANDIELPGQTRINHTRPVDAVDKLRQENAELRSALRRTRDEDVKFERIVDTLREVTPPLLETHKSIPYQAVKKGGRQKGVTLVLLWSDAHAGEVVSPEETNDLGEYDWSIMQARHATLRERLASWIDLFGPVERLIIPSLGDGISGDIHDELRETNEMTMGESILEWGLFGADWLYSLAELVPEILVPCVRGNHSRFTKKPQAKKAFSSGDWLANHFMAQRLRGHKRITFEIPKSARHFFEVYGRRVLMLHGDMLPPSSMIDVPFGGVIRYHHKILKSYAFDHMVMGHFHQSQILLDGRIVVNGAIKGVDEYVLSKYGTGAPPRQVLMPFHPKHGLMGVQYLDL